MEMDMNDVERRIAFLQRAENLKSTIRSAYTASGRQESSAEHSWRLCLMILAFETDMPGLDVAKLLKMAVLHDLGEAICGDVPAVQQTRTDDKAGREMCAMEQLLADLPETVRETLFALWREYEDAVSPEAKFLKGLDKLETIIQHNQGDNPDDFDYAFNLAYGRQYMDAHPLLAAIRAYADDKTRENVARRKR